MYPSVYDFKAFYNTRVGRVVRRILQARLREIWPDMNGMRLMGCGYALPFLRMYADNAERVFAFSPHMQGIHAWPPEGPNLAALAEEGALPFENSSIDRILLVHTLEFSEMLGPFMAELWRVLKADGRLLIVVPNRMGLWARADWSPLGQGRPFSVSQLCRYLRDNRFIHEQTEEALFIPPLQSNLLLKVAGTIEKLGKTIIPVAAGVHIVEASKQLYAPVDRGSKARVKERGVLAPKPAV